MEKYEVKHYQTSLSFEEATGYKYNQNLKVFFNKNNSGLYKFGNFINAEEKWFEEEEELYGLAEKLKMPNWAVISFYQENGYDGVYTRTGDQALTIKCNNWVNQGRDGFLFIAFAETKEQLNCFVKHIDYYINNGFGEVVISEEEETIDSYLIIQNGDFKKAIKYFKENYNLTDEKFDILYW